MVRRTLAIALAAALMAGTALRAAGSAPRRGEAEESRRRRPPAPEGLPNNIRIELTITDQAGPGAAEKRTVSMMVADRKVGSIRSQGRVMSGWPSHSPSR